MAASILCSCGCGEAVGPGAHYRRGHNKRRSGVERDGERLCITCNQWRGTGEFFTVSSKNLRLRAVCKLCHKQSTDPARRAYYERNKGAIIARVTSARLVDRETSRRASRRTTAKLRDEMLDAYGSACACCWETQRCFLTLDHIFGDGGVERRAFGKNGGSSANRRIMYRLRIQGWPTERYRLLCWNCQWGVQQANGCPHQSILTDLLRQHAGTVERSKIGGL